MYVVSARCRSRFNARSIDRPCSSGGCRGDCPGLRDFAAHAQQPGTSRRPRHEDQSTADLVTSATPRLSRASAEGLFALASLVCLEPLLNIRVPAEPEAYGSDQRWTHYPHLRRATMWWRCQ